MAEDILDSGGENRYVTQWSLDWRSTFRHQYSSNIHFDDNVNVIVSKYRKIDHSFQKTILNQLFLLIFCVQNIKLTKIYRFSEEFKHFTYVVTAAWS